MPQIGDNCPQNSDFLHFNYSRIYTEKGGIMPPYEVPHKGNQKTLWQKAHSLKLIVACILSSSLNVLNFGTVIAEWRRVKPSGTSVTPFPSTTGSVEPMTRR